MRGRALATVALAAVLTGCGVQRDDAPRALSPQGVPFDLLGPTTSMPPRTSRSPAEETRASVYLVDRQGLLLEVGRTVPSPPDASRAVAALLEGVTEAEADVGVRSAITTGTDLLGITGPDDGLVTIDLSGELTNIAGQGQRLALAQVVFTATAARDVNRVLFRFDGEARQVPDDSGALTDRPLTRRDFARFDPNVPTATTTPPPPPAATGR